MEETLEALAQALRKTPVEAASIPRFLELSRLLHRLSPTRERDGLLALVYLRLYQLRREEEDFLLGYSYARTSRVEAVRLLAERLKGEGL